MSDLEKRYVEKFGMLKMPPILQTVSYDDDIYQTLFKKALDRGSPITEEDFKGIPDYDMSSSSKRFSDFSKKAH
jgi:hypothetical protein